MKKQVEDWVSLADKDLYAAGILLNDKYPLTNIVVFHCQQVIEKYLKAFIIDKNVQIIKTHDLIKLNGMVNNIKNLNIDEKKIIKINEVYTESRYPGEIGLLSDNAPSFEEAKEFLNYAKEIKEIIIKELS